MSGALRYRTAASGVLAAAVAFVALLAGPPPSTHAALPTGPHRSGTVSLHPLRHPDARWQVHARTRQPAAEQIHPPGAPELAGGAPLAGPRPLGTLAAAAAGSPGSAGVRLAQVRAPPAAGH